jgi:hypothetical protein
MSMRRPERTGWRRPALVAARLGLAVGGLLLALLVAEGAARWLAGQPLLTWRLGPPRLRPGGRLALDAEMARPLPDDVRAAWLAAPPAPVERPPPEPRLIAMAAAAARNGVPGFQALRLWNAEAVRQLGCAALADLQRLPPPLALFEPTRPGAVQPLFRYLPDNSLPGGLVTNRFGFRGPDLPVDKPPDTIRVAFVGASTTVGLWHLP